MTSGDSNEKQSSNAGTRTPNGTCRLAVLHLASDGRTS